MAEELRDSVSAEAHVRRVADACVKIAAGLSANNSRSYKPKNNHFVRLYTPRPVFAGSFASFWTAVAAAERCDTSQSVVVAKRRTLSQSDVIGRKKTLRLRHAKKNRSLMSRHPLAIALLIRGAFRGSCHVEKGVPD
jgi:hypothetical protein